MKSVFRFFTLPLLLLAFALFLSGCGDGGGPSGGSGKPATPKGVTVTPGDRSVTVTWDPVPGATSYTIYYTTDTGATGVIENVKGSPYVVTGLENGVTYTFSVTAVNSKGESGTSDAQSSRPSPAPTYPRDVSAAGGNNQITVTWGPVPDATSYTIYWSTSPGVKKGTGTEIANAVSPYVLTGLQNGRTYYIVVTAVNGIGESAESAEQAVTPRSAVQPPPSPTGISGTAADRAAVIDWYPVPNATSYTIYYSTTPGVKKTGGTKIDNVSGGPYTVTGLTNFIAYYFVVTSVGPGGESEESREVAVTPYAPPASIPAGVTATAGNGRVTVGWNPVANATSYNIYYSTHSGVKKATGTKIPGVSSPHAVTGLTNFTTYYFVVTAVGSGGESAESAERSATPVTAPARPSSVAATAGDSRATVSWYGVTGATSYNIYYSTSPGVTKAASKIANVTNPYTVAGLRNGVTYYFAVTAVNASGESDISTNEAAATPAVGAVPPVAPTRASATPGNAQVTVSWRSVPNAVSYTVYYSTTPGVTKAGAENRIAGVTSPYTVTGLRNGATYYFVVTAVNAAGESPESDEVSARPSSAPSRPSAPTGLTVTGGSRTVAVTWDTVPTATSYIIYFRDSSSTTTSDLLARGTTVTVPAADPQPETMSYDVTGLLANTSYAFVVTAVNTAGESGAQLTPKYAVTTR